MLGVELGQPREYSRRPTKYATQRHGVMISIAYIHVTLAKSEGHDTAVTRSKEPYWVQEACRSARSDNYRRGFRIPRVCLRKETEFL